MTDTVTDEQWAAWEQAQREDSTWQLEVGWRVYHEDIYQQLQDSEVLEKMYRNGEISFAELPSWAQEAEIERCEMAAGWDPNP